MASKSELQPGTPLDQITKNHNKIRGPYTRSSFKDIQERASLRINNFSKWIFTETELTNEFNKPAFPFDFLEMQNPINQSEQPLAEAKKSEVIRNFKYHHWSKGFLGDFTPQDHLGFARDLSEKSCGGATNRQTINTQGLSAAHTDTINGERTHNESKEQAVERAKEVYSWNPGRAKFHETDICWICGKHLNLKTYNGDQCTKIQTPQSEHKNPCFSMAILASGLAKLKRGGRQISTRDTVQDEDLELTFEDNLTENNKIIYQNWKLQVRAQGMSWSHAYCNNIKSQTPYMSLRQFSNQTSGKITYEYVIERNAILGSLIKIWKPRIALDETKRTAGQFNILNATTGGKRFFKLDDDGITPLLVSIDKLLENKEQNIELEVLYDRLYDTIKGIVENQQGPLPHFVIAFLNIIKRLIPLCCLLNQGSNINNISYYSNLLKYTDGTSSSFSDTLSTCSIRQRIENNCIRMLAFKGCTENSTIGKIAKETKLNSSTKNDDNDIQNLLLKFYNCETTILAESVDKICTLKLSNRLPTVTEVEEEDEEEARSVSEAETPYTQGAETQETQGETQGDSKDDDGDDALQEEQENCQTSLLSNVNDLLGISFFDENKEHDDLKARIEKEKENKEKAKRALTRRRDDRDDASQDNALLIDQVGKEANPHHRKRPRRNGGGRKTKRRKRKCKKKTRRKNKRKKKTKRRRKRKKKTRRRR